MNQAPTNAAAYAEALAAADGYTIKPISAAEVTPDMELHYEGQWRVVRYKSPAGDYIRLDFRTDHQGETAFCFTKAGDEFYRRIQPA